MDKNFEELELRAYENDAEAQYELAVYYKNKQNNKSYVDWLKKSAKLNNSNAKVELAELYLQGVLIDKDEDLAISLLEEELEVNKNARLVLGKYYVNTRDEENIKKGLDLLLSIAGENAKATYEIGMSLCFLDDDAAKLWALNLDYNYKQNDNGELPDEFTKLDFNTIVKEDFKSKDMQYAGVRLLDKAWNMGEKRAAFALAMVSSDNRFVNPDKSIALQYLNELDDTFWIEKCFILNLWKDYSGILKILNNAEDGSIKDYLLARLYENYGFKKYDLSKSDKLYTKLFNNIQNSCDDDERIILSDLYCRGKGTEENIQKARETIDNCRVYYAHGRCSYDEVLNYDNIYNEKLDLDLRKYYNKFISIYNKTLEFDDDKYTYMFVQSKIPCILERSRLIYSTLYDELQNVYQDKTLDEKEIIKDIIGFYQSNLMFLSGVIEDFVADNWDVDIESDFCYKDFLKDIFEDTEYNNYINNVVEYIKSSYDYQQIELDKLVDEFNADCKNANVLKNTIKSKKTAEENLFSPITLGDVVMGAIAYGTMEDTKNEYNEYSSDVRTYIEAAEEEKADILEHVREKLADRCVDDYLEKLKGIISSDELKELYNKVLESKNEKISVIICRKIMDILKEAGIVSKLFDYDFSGEELFEKCKNASEPLRYLLLALETEPTNKKYYEYAISNYGDLDGNLYALAAMNGINIFSSINQIIEDGISGSREDFEKILDNFSLDKNKYLEEYDEKHEQMLMDKIAAKKPEYSSDSVRQKILTEDYEKFLATLNTDTTEYLKKYLAVANSYSEINKIFDIKAEKIEFAKIIKYVCGNLLKIEVDVSLTEKQLKIAEGLILAYKNNKKITKDDFISLTLENDTMPNDKDSDTEVLFFTMKDTLLSNEQGFALTNKGILYTDEQNEISMLDYNSIISFEVTRKFLSTKLMVVTSEGKIIELKNDFASDKMDDAVIYIKAMIKEIMASDIYIGESPVMVSNVTAPNNDMTKADNVTAESTDKVSDLRAGLNSNELPALLKQYFSTHAEPEKAMASSKLKAGLSLPSDCEVYYAQDATLLGSGKNGFAITSKGVYTRKMFEKNVIIKPLDVFKTGKQFSTDKSTPGLLLDGQFFVECLSGDKLVPLFNGLVEYLDKAKAENSAVSESDNSATKYCPNCGTALRGQAKFCSKCGYKL